jgi:hypothetical protein
MGVSCGSNVVRCAQIVEAIERVAGDHLADQVERLALHAFRGEVWEKALTYLRQAGDKAMGRSAYREAVAYCEQALEALQPLPESYETQKEAIDLRLNLRNVLLPLGEQGRIFDHLHVAATLAEVLQDQYRLGWIQERAQPPEIYRNTLVKPSTA